VLERILVRYVADHVIRVRKQTGKVLAMKRLERNY
jgi:hypothetical protein